MIKTILSLMLLTAAALASSRAALAAEANFNLYIKNVDPNYDAYISGNEANRQDIGYAPAFSNTLLSKGSQLSGPFDFTSVEGWANYAISPFCGNEEHDNVVRVTLRANQNGSCNGQTPTQNPPNDYVQIINTRGFNTCVEVEKSTGATISAESGTDTDGTPKITLKLRYDPNYKPVAHIPGGLCYPNNDYCVVFKNDSSGNAYIDGTDMVHSGDGPDISHRRLLPPNGQIVGNYHWTTTYIGQGGGAAVFERRNVCDGSPTAKVKLSFNASQCEAGAQMFKVRNVFTKSGSVVTACASSDSPSITLSVDKNGLGPNQPIITATFGN